MTNRCLQVYNKMFFSENNNWIWVYIDFEGRLSAVHACGMRKENTAAPTSTLNCRRTESVNDSFDFEFQSRLHECETKIQRGNSTLLMSRYTFVCRLFLLSKRRLQLNDRLNGIWFCDDFFLSEERARQRRLKRGQELHSGRPAKPSTRKTAEMSHTVTSRELVRQVPTQNRRFSRFTL